jgi:NAD(P)-dependent dehydrogenase (short-subunit alcohol dehydrogenase family)
MAGYLDTAGALEYGVSKYGLRSLMTNLRHTEWMLNIRINFVGPWFVETRIMPGHAVAYLKACGAEFASVEDAASAMLRIVVDTSINGMEFNHSWTSISSGKN